MWLDRRLGFFFPWSFGNLGVTPKTTNEPSVLTTYSQICLRCLLAVAIRQPPPPPCPGRRNSPLKTRQFVPHAAGVSEIAQPVGGKSASASAATAGGQWGGCQKGQETRAASQASPAPSRQGTRSRRSPSAPESDGFAIATARAATA